MPDVEQAAQAVEQAAAAGMAQAIADAQAEQEREAQIAAAAERSEVATQIAGEAAQRSASVEDRLAAIESGSESWRSEYEARIGSLSQSLESLALAQTELIQSLSSRAPEPAPAPTAAVVAVEAATPEGASASPGASGGPDGGQAASSPPKASGWRSRLLRR